MKLKAQIQDEAGLNRALMRIAHEIVEHNKGAENLCLVGVRRRGEPIARRIAENIQKIEDRTVPVGVNFSGTVLTAEEIELGKNGYLTINSDNSLGFTGETDISIKEFMEMNLDEDFENNFSNSDGMKM